MTREAIRMHAEACACAWCDEGRALGRAMERVRLAPSHGDGLWREIVDPMPEDEWRALASVLAARHDWGASITTRAAVLRANLRWQWNITRIAREGAA
jgi:hypothetical protein